MKLKIIIAILIGLACAFISVVYLNRFEESREVYSHISQNYKKEIKDNLPKDHSLIVQQNALWKYINKNINIFQSEFGEPDRKDPSLYGYEWWIYNNKDFYFQVAVQNATIISFYTNSPNLDVLPLIIGQGVDELQSAYTFTNTFEVDNLRFKLSEQDIKERPLIRLSDQIFAQLYIDQFSETLAGIRIMNKNVLELLKPYELFYWGELNEVDNFIEDTKVEASIEKQIFDLTNEIRGMYNLNDLAWDEQAAIAAKAHSKDMKTESYFSHYSLNGDGLKERLIAAQANYFSAGENIAAHYIDAPAVIHGWLNSSGHREAILKKEYTHLGVGVYQSYYTQNFIDK
ncbi:allergen V5/Tpx-1 related [Gracilibacillus boraciitolerans JCM 21714]|uniref:Allergen V5/Tpx-1 related n=1 Tax=Gracilibacillus boraciitolerans JCM 21714 TaxID=1298598 RepID=W4VED2_9BACI|nr:CAP domain-containing protein [Gracilibacillus boraciitolerans]GAE91765.1 allergen V5/Tpx-1 related [Gracilibacillus boraciitolerans JCM 21714]